MLISKEFKFDAAHNLLKYKGKCENLHGHTYKLRVTVSGEPDDESGMIIDFNLLKKIVEERIIDKLDHTYINNIVEQSTAENIIKWIWKELKAPLMGDNFSLYELVLWETETSFVTMKEE